MKVRITKKITKRRLKAFRDIGAHVSYISHPKYPGLAIDLDTVPMVDFHRIMNTIRIKNERQG